MALMDLYKKYMYGTSGMGEPTQGLFGTGGEKSGGLIDFNKMNNQQGGLLQNIPQTALLGSAMFGQGIQGKDPFSALLPAVTQTAQLQKYMTPELKKPTFETFKKGDVVKTINTSTRAGLAEATKLTDGGYTKFSQSVQGASISDLQKGTKATAEKELKSGLFLLDDLNLIEAAYSPEFSTIEGRAKFKLLAAKDKIAPASMSSPDKQYLSSFGVWDANSQQYFNRYRKEITGVAAGEKEIGYLKNSIPSDTDSPSIYIAKLKNQKKIQERLNNSAADFLKVGSGSVYTTLQDGSRQYSEEFLNHVKENKVPPTGEEIKNILEAYKIDRGYEYKQAKQFLDIEYKGVNWEDILNNYIKIK